MGFVKDGMAGGFETTRVEVQISNILVGGSVTEKNTVEGVPIEFGRAFTGNFNGDPGPKSAKVGQVGGVAKVALEGCLIECPVPETILKVNRMKERVRPETRWETGSVEEAADHDTKSPIEAFNFSVLVGSVTAGGFHHISSIQDSLLERIRASQFTTLVHPDGSMRAISASLFIKELAHVGGWGFLGAGEEAPGIATSCVRDKEVGAEAIVRFHNTRCAWDFSIRVGGGTHKAKIDVKTVTRVEGLFVRSLRSRLLVGMSVIANIA